MQIYRKLLCDLKVASESTYSFYTCLIQLSQTEILVVQDLASLKVHVVGIVWYSST